MSIEKQPGKRSVRVRLLGEGLARQRFAALCKGTADGVSYRRAAITTVLPAEGYISSAGVKSLSYGSGGTLLPGGNTAGSMRAEVGGAKHGRAGLVSLIVKDLEADGQDVTVSTVTLDLIFRTNY